MGKERINAKDDLFFTRTMAEVLEGQGHMEDALVIYKILSDTCPDDEVAGLKVRELKKLARRVRDDLD